MTKSIALVVAVLLGVLAVMSVGKRASGGGGSSPKHHVVFELTNEDPAAWQKVLTNAENLQRALGPANTSIEIVGHGGGLGLLVAARSAPIKERLQQDSEHGIVFAACENTMKKQSVTKQDLVPFAITVDSGVAEVVRKQEAGWAYVRNAP